MSGKRIIPRICEQCGAPFMAARDQVESGRGRFCSKSCAARSHHRNGMSLEEAFWSHVTRTETCWLWTRGLGTSGYGAFRALGRNVPAHRFAYELVTGPVPDGKIVCHTCDNPLCCRNDDEGWYEIDGIALPRRGHLFLGTQKDNAVDRTNKWRHPHGESHPKAKLTDNDVVAIREAFTGKRGELTTLAMHYGVDRSTIERIVHGKRWRHV